MKTQPPEPGGAPPTHDELTPDQLREELRALRDQVTGLTEERSDLYRQLAKEGGWAAGHYYSPIPDQAEVEKYLGRSRLRQPELLEIEFNSGGQLALLEEFACYQDELPFPEQQTGGCRYYYDNEWFSYADAIFLHCFLRKHQPRRIIEVGSGFSSAAMLDTIDRFFDRRPEVTFIEPYPDRLGSLLGEADAWAEVVESKVQDVSPAVFQTLEAGDLLFIDSSHVIKCGGDLQFLMFEVLPKLPSGVFVQFHDIFHPFEYPEMWLKQERNWNELYLLRAFLAYNRGWRIHFFNSYVASAFREFLESRLPLCTRSAGASLYLQRL